VVVGLWLSQCAVELARDADAVSHRKKTLVGFLKEVPARLVAGAAVAAPGASGSYGPHNCARLPPRAHSPQQRATESLPQASERSVTVLTSGDRPSAAPNVAIPASSSLPPPFSSPLPPWPSASCASLLPRRALAIAAAEEGGPVTAPAAVVDPLTKGLEEGSWPPVAAGPGEESTSAPAVSTCVLIWTGEM
jgi:hypothetical protein